MADKTKKAAANQAPASAAKPKVTAAAAPEAPSDANPAVEEATPEKSSAVEAVPTTYESILSQIKKAQEA